MLTIIRDGKSGTGRSLNAHELSVGFSQIIGGSVQWPTVRCRVSFAVGHEKEAEQFAERLRALIDEQLPDAHCAWTDKTAPRSTFISRLLGNLSNRLKGLEFKARTLSWR